MPLAPKQGDQVAIQLDTAWPNRDRGSDKPRGKHAPMPKRGDGLPREPKPGLAKGFVDHALAVAYARSFNDHVPVGTVLRLNRYGYWYKVFVVDPAKGRRALTNKMISKVNP